MLILKILLFLLKRYKQLGSFVIVFTPLMQERLALKPKSFIICSDSLEIEPKGYVNVLGI